LPIKATGPSYNLLRKNLKLTQVELSEVFGVGKLAFSRYERGKTQPPAPLVKLLKLVERHPNLMNEIREVSTSHSLIDRAVRISGNQQAG
jgi:HTH-type transcriptional regulator/antitoxin MqsA